jgi:hypothetical protein
MVAWKSRTDFATRLIVLVAGGATMAQAQEHIEEQVEWFTDLFYEGLTPEEAAKEALND